MYKAWSERLGADVFKHLLDVSSRKGVDPVLVLNLIQQESGGNPKAVSYVGAKGVMQVMPFHYSACGVSDPHDAKQNITCGVGILADAIKQAKGDYRLALALYNGGSYGKRKYKAGYPCAPYVKDKRNDCLQNKHYVQIISKNYEADKEALKDA